MNVFNNKKENIVDTLNGIVIHDPYRWLEDATNPEVEEWIKIQNKYLDSSLRNNNFNKFSDELTKNFKVVDFSNPFPVKGRYFYYERQPDEDQKVLYVKKGIDSNPVKLINPNVKISNNTTSIDYSVVSRSGKYVAYGLSSVGNEMSTLYILDVDNNINLPEKVINCRHSSISWLSNDSGFFYTRNPRPGTVPKNEESMHTKVYFHKLGCNPENDELIFGENRPKNDMINITLSVDEKYLAVHTSFSWTENEIYIYDIKSKEIKPLIVNIPAKFALYFIKDKVIILTNYNANNYRIISSLQEKLFLSIDQWDELIPERDYLLQSVSVTKSKIIIKYLENVCSKVLLFDYIGRELEEIPLPKYSTLMDISSNRNEEEFFYGLTSFIFPKITYRYSPEKNEYYIYQKTDNPINPEDYEVKQEWFESKDGIKIPMFIFHKKNISLNKLNPTILYGYGGFGNSQTPSFTRNWTPWIKRGGVIAVANIRGGGEFGEKWHKQGIKENKKNSFNDFIEASEFLIKNNYTNKDHLGIMGASNGGLLVSAVSVQRPDLFKAVCSRVPLTDMVRFPLFGMASRWVNEYGDPSKKEELENIIKWSPYHNVKEGVEYPSMLFTAGIEDTRVNPLHSRKMTAILQSTNKINPVFLLTEMETGHGSGKPIKKIIESSAIILTFFSEKLGLKI